MALLPILCFPDPRLHTVAKPVAVVDERRVVQLDEGFQRNTERLAIMQKGAVVIGNAPRPGVEIIALGKADLLRRATELGIGVTAVKRPVPATGAIVVFDDLDLVAGLAQFMGGEHSGQPGAKHDNRGAGAGARQIGRPGELRFPGMAHGFHRLIQHRSAAEHSDRVKDFAPRRLTSRNLSSRCHRLRSPHCALQHLAMLAGDLHGRKPCL